MYSVSCYIISTFCHIFYTYVSSYTILYLQCVIYCICMCQVILYYSVSCYTILYVSLDHMCAVPCCTIIMYSAVTLYNRLLCTVQSRYTIDYYVQCSHIIQQIIMYSAVTLYYRLLCTVQSLSLIHISEPTRR